MADRLLKSPRCSASLARALELTFDDSFPAPFNVFSETENKTKSQTDSLLITNKKEKEAPALPELVFCL